MGDRLQHAFAISEEEESAHERAGSGPVIPAKQVGIWVGASLYGSPVFSTDGVQWRQASVNVQGPIHLKAVAYGKGLFVAVGNQLLSSKDGRRWISTRVPNKRPLNAVAHLDSIWVAVGDNAQIVYSTDCARKWSGVMARFPGHYRAITAGNGRFVVVGQTLNGRGLINTSTDGKTWSGEQVGGAPLLSIAYGAGRFVATDLNGSIHISTDGLNWTTLKIQRHRAIRAIRYLNGVFVCIGDNGKYHWSLECEEWTTEEAFIPRDVAYGGGSYVGRSRTGRIYCANSFDSWQRNEQLAHRVAQFVYGNSM